MNQDQEWQEGRAGQTDELLSYLLGHVEETALDTESDYLGSKPTSAVSQWWTLSKLYNLSQPQFLLKTTKCNCTGSHPRGLQ